MTAGGCPPWLIISNGGVAETGQRAAHNQAIRHQFIRNLNRDRQQRSTARLGERSAVRTLGEGCGGTARDHWCSWRPCWRVIPIMFEVRRHAAGELDIESGDLARGDPKRAQELCSPDTITLCEKRRELKMKIPQKMAFDIKNLHWARATVMIPCARPVRRRGEWNDRCSVLKRGAAPRGSKKTPAISSPHE